MDTVIEAAKKGGSTKQVGPSRNAAHTSRRLIRLYVCFDLPTFIDLNLLSQVVPKPGSNTQMPRSTSSLSTGFTIHGLSGRAINAVIQLDVQALVSGFSILKNVPGAPRSSIIPAANQVAPAFITIIEWALEIVPVGDVAQLIRDFRPFLDLVIPYIQLHLPHIAHSFSYQNEEHQPFPLSTPTLLCKARKLR